MKIFWIMAIVIIAGLLLVGAAKNNKTQWEYAIYGEIYGKYSWETGQNKITRTEEEMKEFIECRIGR